MKDMNIEQLLVLLFFVLIPLLQFIVERLRKRGVMRRPPAETTPPTPHQIWIPATSSVEATLTSGHGPIAQTQRGPSPHPDQRLSHGKLLASREELRRAIIYKTILETCRADNPPA